jgi:outer membrane protein OmpA-like peptidoglycan-associated protein
MKNNFLFILTLVFMFPAFVMAGASIPVKDLPGSADPQFLKRFEGSLIVAYKHKAYARFTFPLSALKPTGEKEKDIELYGPEKSRVLEGDYTRVAYLVPQGHGPLEVIRNYENHLRGLGGKVLYTCEGKGCGGHPNHASWIWFGKTSLGYFLESMNSVASYNKKFSTGYCALASSSIRDQKYIVVELPEKGVTLSILAYTLGDTSGCEAIKDRTVAVVDTLKSKPMEQKMVVVKAEKMASEIGTRGSVALYGIYFDTGKAEIKPDSKPTLDQVAKLLRSKPSLNILVVGHTDNQGTFDYNMELSRRRAQAVVNELVSGYGIGAGRLQPVGVGYACPRASNRTPEGRAKNRRVELVESSGH